MLLTMFRYSRMEAASLVSRVLVWDQFIIYLCRMPPTTAHQLFVFVNLKIGAGCQ